jgi:hypothetical protein
MKIATVLVLLVTIVGLILVNFAFAKISAISIIFSTILTGMAFVVSQVWIRKVPDVKKREDQTFRMLKSAGKILLILWILSWIFFLLIFILPKKI